MPGTMAKRIIPENAIPTASQVRELRTALGLTLESMAEKIGVKPSTVYGWELPSQKRRPSASHAILLRLLENGDL